MLLALLPAIVQPRRERKKTEREKELESDLERAWRRNEELVIERDHARLELYRMSQARIEERLNPLVSYQSGEGACQMAQYLQAQQAAAQASFNQQGWQNYAAMQNAQNAHAWGLGELIDCTGGGRARHLAGLGL